MGSPVVHFEVIGKDAAALQRFYKNAFDWEIGEPIPGSPVNYAIAHPNGGGGIEGGIGGAMDGYPGHVTFYVAVNDLDTALAKIQGLGGTTTMPPEQVPGGPKIALFSDPEGHVVGLVEPDGNM